MWTYEFLVTHYGTMGPRRKCILKSALTITWFTERLILLPSLQPTRRDIEIIALFSCHSPRSAFLSLIHISLLSQGPHGTCFTYEPRPILAVNQYFATYMYVESATYPPWWAMSGLTEFLDPVCRCAFPHELHTDRLPLGHSNEP